MENNTKRRMLTIGEAARLIDGITEYRIRTLCKSRQLRSFKAGNKFLIAEDDLIEAVLPKKSFIPLRRPSVFSTFSRKRTKAISSLFASLPLQSIQDSD